MGNNSKSCKMSNVLLGLVGVVEATIGQCIGRTLVPCQKKTFVGVLAGICWVLEVVGFYILLARTFQQEWYCSGKAVEVARIQGGCGTGKSFSTPRNTWSDCWWQAYDTCHSLPPMDYPCIQSLVEVLPAMPSISILQLPLLRNIGQRYWSFQWYVQLQGQKVLYPQKCSAECAIPVLCCD